MTRTKATKKKSTNPIRVGNAVFIRTVTHYYTGRIVAIEKDVIVLADAAWVADTKRFSETIATGALNEVEVYPSNVSVAVGRGAIVDVCDWLHALPRTTL